MKALLICPADRPAVARLAERTPLVLAPLLSHSALEYWIEILALRGAKQLLVLATDRPHLVREAVGDGRRWGLHIDVIPSPRELTVEEARAKHRPPTASDWLAEDVILIDHLPGQPNLPLFENCAGWFAAVRAWMPAALTPVRIGVRQVSPGVWVGLRADVHPTAQLVAPCWIGDHTRVGPGTRIGPGAILDDRVVVETGARVSESLVGPDTYVGKYVSVERSLVRGPTLINWHSGSSVEVPDAFLLGQLTPTAHPVQRTSLIGRGIAAFFMLATAPFVIGVVVLSIIRGELPWQLRLGLRRQPGARQFSHDTFGYYELTGARNWLRRWPQFWSVMCGDLSWIGNRPLRPTQALALTNDFERLWLAAPVGLVSLADARGCPEGVSDEACAHASFYAVNANRRLDWYIFSRVLIRAAMVWPIRGHRRKDATVPLEELVPKQEI